MGLDLTELVLEAQDEFGIAIPEDTAPLLVSDLLDATLSALRQQHPERFAANASYGEDVWQQLRAMIAKQLGIDSEKVVKSANFIVDLGCV